MRALYITALLALTSCQAIDPMPSTLAGPVPPRSNCAPRPALITGLIDGYGERQVARGLTLDGALLEVHAGDAGSFTVLLSGPSGFSCLIAAGEAWQLVPPPPTGDPT
jgi:hypothetical protein